MDNKSLGVFLKQRRKKLHLSQSFIADKLGYSTQILSSWERGISTPNLSCWNDLMDLLQIDINGLLECKPINKITGHTFDENKFVFNLKDLRLNKGLTQIELANKLGVNNKTISSWENNSSLPSMEDFIHLSEIFGVSYADLFYGEHIEEQQEPIPVRKKDRKWVTPIAIIAGCLALVAGVVLPFALTAKNKRNNPSPIASDSLISSSDFSDNSSEITSSQTLETSSSESESEEIPPIEYAFSFALDSLELSVGESSKLEFSINPVDEQVTWESENPNVVSISDGVVTALKYGDTKITATLVNAPDISDSMIIRCKYSSDAQYQSFMECDRETMEFMYPSEKKVARFYFEDKNTIIHEELFETTDDFSYNFPEPLFGPLKGWNYEFKGWDINNDGIVDELPEKLAKDTDFYAIYEKTPTEEPDFCLFNHYTTVQLKKDYNIFIIPTSEYFDSISPSDVYSGQSDSLNRMVQIEYLVPMCGWTSVQVNLYQNLKCIRYQKTIQRTSGTFPSEIIFDGGYISGSIWDRVRNGIANKYLKLDSTALSAGAGYTKNMFSNCPKVECLMLIGDKYTIWGEGCFSGLTNLKVFNTKEFNYKRDNLLSELNYTKINYLDARAITGGGLIAPNCDEMTLLIPTLLDDTNIEFENGKAYNVLLGYDESPLTDEVLLGDAISQKSNLKFYFYSETPREDGWHFNDYGFPTNIYN